jgi:RNA polymerase sigma-70 factor (ECF subfamily)
MRRLSAERETETATTPRGFSTTRWSLIVTGAKVDTDEQVARKALAELCHTYWRPIFWYICCRGHSEEDAQDLTQDFFAMMLETNWLKHADQKRGRFRSLLRKSLDRFLHDAHDRNRAQRRGGGVQFVAWDDWMAEAPSQLRIAPGHLDKLKPEELFDVRWAATVVEQALRLLAGECEAKGRRRLFETLSAHLTVHDPEISYATLATTLGLTEQSVKRQLYNLRLRYRWLLRQEVGRTLSTPDEIDEELRYLCCALASTT